MTALYEKARTHLADIETDFATLETEIPLGGPESYIEVLKDGFQTLKGLANGYWVAHQDFMSLIHMALGAYAGSQAPTGSAAVNISAFNDKLWADGEAILSATITKNAWAAGGSNTGNGEVVELTTGTDGLEMQAVHAESLKMECVGPGLNGRSRFNLQGSERTYFLWDDAMGTGNLRGGYRFDWGSGANEFSDAQRLLVTSEEAALVAWTGDDRRNMVQNGAFEEPLGTGTTKIAGATILSGEANIGLETSTQIKGDQSLQFTGDGALEFPTQNSQVGRVEFMSMWIARRGTKTGTLTIKYRSGTTASPTDHFTITQDISALTADVLTLKKLAFVVPAAVGVNPRIRVELATSGSTGSLDCDELVGGVCSLFDSNRALAIIEGTTKFRRGDVFTASTSVGAYQPYQRMFAELFGRSVKHANPAVYWVKS